MEASLLPSSWSEVDNLQGIKEQGPSERRKEERVPTPTKIYPGSRHRITPGNTSQCLLGLVGLGHGSKVEPLPRIPDVAGC